MMFKKQHLGIFQKPNIRWLKYHSDKVWRLLQYEELVTAGNHEHVDQEQQNTSGQVDVLRTWKMKPFGQCAIHGHKLVRPRSRHKITSAHNQARTPQCSEHHHCRPSHQTHAHKHLLLRCCLGGGSQSRSYISETKNGSKWLISGRPF